jgi:L-alanine-DL-glutamate epimerase-like enolase superfamily enzyme
VRITDIRTTRLAVPLARVFRGGTYEITARCTVITEVWTDTGLSGCTYAGDERARQQDIVQLIEARLKPLLIGQDPLDHERLWGRMFQETVPHGDRATILQAVAAVDIALWDLKGKAAGLSVHKLLGGSHERLPAIVIGGYYEDDKGIDGLIAEMVGYRDQGFAGVKMKVGRVDVREDAERVHEVRKAVGDRFMIACDANQAWTPEQAIDFCRAVAGGTLPLVRRPRRYASCARAHGDSGHRRAERDHQVRLPGTGARGCRRHLKRRRVTRRGRHRMA